MMVGQVMQVAMLPMLSAAAPLPSATVAAPPAAATNMPHTWVAADFSITCQSSALLATSCSRLAASSSTTASGCRALPAAAATLTAPSGPCKAHSSRNRVSAV